MILKVNFVLFPRPLLVTIASGNFYLIYLTEYCAAFLSCYCGSQSPSSPASDFVSVMYINRRDDGNEVGGSEVQGNVGIATAALESLRVCAL